MIERGDWWIKMPAPRMALAASKEEHVTYMTMNNEKVSGRGLCPRVKCYFYSISLVYHLLRNSIVRTQVTSESQYNRAVVMSNNGVMGWQPG